MDKIVYKPKIFRGKTAHQSLDRSFQVLFQNLRMNVKADISLTRFSTILI